MGQFQTRSAWRVVAWTMVLGTLLFECSSLAADVPAAGVADRAQIQALIAQLGDPKFSIRKAASNRLAQIGLPAYSALEDARQHPDREVRFRAEKVLSLIRQNDLERRLTAFLASKEIPPDDALPSWGRFRKTYGSDPAARSLFVDMQRVDGELLASLQTDPRQGAERLGRRVTEYQTAQQLRTFPATTITQLTFAEVALLLFVAAEEDVKPSSQTMAAVLTYCNHAGFREGITSSQNGETARKMLTTVIRKSEDSAVYTAILMALNFDIKDGLVPAIKSLEGQGAKVRPNSQYAMLAIVRFGDDSHLPILEKQFEDNTRVSTSSVNGVRREIQVRDTALAAAVMLTKQEMKDYFDVPANYAARERLTSSYSILMLGFPDEEQRAAAFAKWQKYKSSRKPAENK